MVKRINLLHEYPQLAFREIKPLLQWSARIALDVPYDEFLQTTLSTAEKMRHRYTGTLTRDTATGNVTSFTHTRFRRNKHGKPATIPECEVGMQVLARKFGTIHEREFLAFGMSRVTLGLYEGQHPTGARAEPEGPDYSIEDISLVLGGEYRVTPSEVLVTMFDIKGNARHYAEESAEVVFPASLKERAYLVAHATMQERFSVEEFADPYGLSYMVETEWCREPDPVEPVEL